MTAFRSLLVLLWVTLAVYTAVVAQNHGLGLLPVFFGDIAAMTWPGQFNLDFLCLLVLSALWHAWRHAFTPAGLGLAVLALFGGALWLMAYLFVLSLRHQGDVTAILLGPQRAADRPR